jgi:hypothetical protein
MGQIAFRFICHISVMAVRVRLLTLAVPCFAVAVLVAAWMTRAQETQEKRAPPPTFDPREVEQIFFTDARKALVGQRPARLPGRSSGPPNVGVSAPPSRTEPPAVPGDGAGWSKLISPETLADEVKEYPLLLAAVVKTPSQFQGKGAREARRYFSTIAAVFAIIAEYDGDVRWKSQAAAARELFARVGFNSKSDTENVYNEARLRTADLAALLRGETLAPPPTIEPKPNFNEQVANRPPLMWRLERAQRDRLAVWTANRADFGRNLGGIKHEAEMVAALAQVIQDASFPDAEDETYIAYARALQAAALEVRTAAKEKNADAARTAAGKLSQACNNCHVDFRGG